MKRPRIPTAAPPRRMRLGTLALVLCAHMAWLFGLGQSPRDQHPAEPPEDQTLRWLATDLQASSAALKPQAPQPTVSKAITEDLSRVPAPEATTHDATEASTETAAEPLPADPASSQTRPPDDKVAASPVPEAPPPAAAEPPPLQNEAKAAPAAAEAPTGAPPEAGDAQALHQMAGQIPAPALLRFRLVGERGPATYHARGELKWQHDTAQYQATFTASLWFAGERTQTSSGSIGPQGLTPHKYTDLWRKNERAVHFDGAQQRLVFSASQNKTLLWPGAQDLVSATVQMSAKLSSLAGHALPMGHRLWLQAAHPREASIWVMERAPDTVLETSKGPVRSSHWVKTANHPRDLRLEAWYALPSDTSPVAISHVWPLRIRISQSNGDYVDQWLQNIEALPALPPGGGVPKN